MEAKWDSAEEKEEVTQTVMIKPQNTQEDVTEKGSMMLNTSKGF